VEQTQTPKYVSRLELLLYVPPSHRTISTKASAQDFPHREPPLKIWIIQTWSTQLLSQTITTSTQEVRH